MSLKDAKFFMHYEQYRPKVDSYSKFNRDSDIQTPI